MTPTAPPIEPPPAASQESPRLRQWQRITLLTLFIGYTGYYVCRSDLSVATPLLIKQFGAQGIDKIAIGKIVSIGTLFYAFGKVVNGITSDFVGGRRMFLIGMIGSILTTLLFGFGSSLGIFTVAWSLNRLVQSMGWSSLVKVASRWFPFKSYGQVMSFLSLSFLLGNAAVKWYLGTLMDRQHGLGLDWRGLFFAAAGTLAVIAAFCAVVLKSGPRDIGEPEQEVSPINLFGEQGSEEKPRNLVDLLTPFFRSPTFWVVAVISFGLTLIRETFGAWTPTYLFEVAHYTEADAAKYSGLFDLFGGVSVVACGYLTDKFFGGKRGLVMAVALALSVLALMGLSRSQEASPNTQLILVSLVALLTIGPYSFLAGAMALDLGGKRGSSTAAGFIDSAGYLSGILAGSGIASIEKQGGWGAAFSALSGVAALTTIAALVYWLRCERVKTV